jgi:hypothetical protein
MICASLSLLFFMSVSLMKRTLAQTRDQEGGASKAIAFSRIPPPPDREKPPGGEEVSIALTSVFTLGDFGQRKARYPIGIAG